MPECFISIDLTSQLGLSSDADCLAHHHNVKIRAAEAVHQECEFEINIDELRLTL
ncbi:MAG: hypothetical protein ACI9DF_004658 [Verrucomicrobiales bacterium]|jgi:hypothetical protein